jgi:acyl-CoA reductase-like NAD-dependent aldehyde dehydrogenase
MPTAENYINGEWVESKGEIIEVTNPATNQPIGRVGISTHGPYGRCAQEF